MADTTYLKNAVEAFVREQLASRYGVPFQSRVLTLVTGGTHEFDAVSADGRVVAAIKAHSGKTARGHHPAAKVRDAEAELYHLTLVAAPIRLLVLTNREFFGIMEQRLTGRLAPGIALEHIRLPDDIQQEVARVQAAASQEVTAERRLTGRP